MVASLASTRNANDRNDVPEFHDPNSSDAGADRREEGCRTSPPHFCIKDLCVMSIHCSRYLVTMSRLTTWLRMFGVMSSVKPLVRGDWYFLGT
jgi:hypothetical protein